MIKKIVKVLRGKAKKVSIALNSNVAFDVINSIGKGAKVSSGVSCSKKVSIGRYTSIMGPNTKLTAKINRIVIGSFCSIAPGVTIQEYEHKYNRISSFYIHRNLFGESVFKDIYSKGDIIIEDDVWIGANSIILSGVFIGRGSIIAAGSVVTKDVPAYSIYGGVPAKKINSRFKDDRIPETLEKSRWWQWSEMELIENKKVFSMSEKEILEYFKS